MVISEAQLRETLA